MRREIKDGWVPIKDILSAVAMMDVPIDDCDALESVARLSVPGAYRRVVEQAKAHRGTWSRVMSGRPHQSKGIIGLPSDYRVNCGDGRSGGKLRNTKRLGADDGVHVHKGLT